MESFQISSNSLCNICGKEVEILNDDLSFSRELHNQSHKNLSDINHLLNESREKVETKLDAVKNYSDYYQCTKCNEHLEIVNNDFELSLQLHSQSHKLKECTTEIQNKETDCNITIEESIDQLLLHLKLINISDLSEEHVQLPISSNVSQKLVDRSSKDLTKNIENNDRLKTVQEQSSKTQPSKESQKCVPQKSGAFKNDYYSKTNHVSKKLEQILNSLPKKLEIFWIKDNNDLQVICTLCECTISLSYTPIMQHLSGGRHRYNKELNAVNSMSKINKEPLKTLQLQSSKTIPSKESCKAIPQQSSKLKNVNVPKMCSANKRLEKILNTLPKDLETLCIKDSSRDGHGECTICGCYISLSDTNIKQHLSGWWHNYYKKQNLANSSFENTSGNLQSNKPKQQQTIKHEEPLRILQLQSSKNVSSKESLDLIPQTSGAFNNYICKRIYNLSENLEEILNSLPKELEIFWIKNNKHGKIMCTLCECAITLSNNPIKEHLSGIRHRHNREEKLVLSMPTNNQLLKARTEMSSKTSELKCMLDDISKQFDTSCITMNEKGDIICSICNCPVHSKKDLLMQHFSGMRHKKNEKNKVVISLFGNIPENLQANKAVIQELAGDKNHVFCCKCNVKVLAHHDWLFEHLQGTKHNVLLGLKKSVKVNKSKLAEPDKTSYYSKTYSSKVFRQSKSKSP